MKKHAAAGLYCLPFDTYSVGPKLSSLETVNDPEAGAVRRGGAVWGGGYSWRALVLGWYVCGAGSRRRMRSSLAALYLPP